MKKLLKLTAMITAFGLLAASVSGCNGTGGGASKEDETLKNASYPLKTDVTLRYWLPLHANVSASAVDLGDTPYAEMMEKRTGVKVKYISPVAGQEQEQLNLLLVSDDVPDMIEYNWYEFTGGPNKAISDGYIIALNDYMDYAPNLSKVLKEHPDYDKMIKTDEGKYYVFPFIRGGDLLLATQGLSIRKDWLDELGLAIPETYDEIYEALKKMKEAKNLSAPLTVAGGSSQSYIDMLLGAFGANTKFYQEDGKIKYGPLEPEFKETLSYLQKLYAEGLLDKNFLTIDTKIVETNMLTDKSAMTFTSAGGQLGKWINAKKSDGKGFNLTGIAYPVKEKGQEPKFGGSSVVYSGANSVAITEQSDNKALAAKYLDYGYGEEGHMAINFGEEGVTYNMVNGEPVYTDLIMKNPDGLAVNQAMGRYFRSSYSGPFIQDEGYIKQYYSMDAQKEAQAQWVKAIPSTRKYDLPQILPTEEESGKVSKIMTNVETYQYSMIYKYIMGTEDLSNISAFEEQLKAFGIEDALAIEQAALERYEKR